MDGKPCKSNWRAQDKDGYVKCNLRTRHDRKKHTVYIRFLYASEHRHTFKRGEVVRHTCNNTWCVEPLHLILGSHQDNMNDAKAIGNYQGSRNGNAKLTEAEVREIRLLGDMQSMEKLADVYCVSKGTIYDILKGNTWKHI